MSSDDPMDDPRLTAHAMGEAAGPLTPEEQAEVDAIRATAETLKAGFAATPMPTLDPAHRAAILQGLSPEAAKPVPGTVPGSVVRLSEYSGLGALAATLLLVIGFGIAGAAGGGITGSAGGSGLYVKSFSAPNYSATYLDGDLGLAFSATSSDALASNTIADFDTSTSFTLSRPVGRAAGGIQPSSRRHDYKGAFGFARAGVGGGGGGAGGGERTSLAAIGYVGGTDASGKPGRPSGADFYNTYGDGDYRGRTEHLSKQLRDRLSNISGNDPSALALLESSKNATIADLRRQVSEAEAMNARNPEKARELVAALTSERGLLKAELAKAAGTVKVLRTKDGSAPPLEEFDKFTVGSGASAQTIFLPKDTGGSGVAMEYVGIGVGAVANQADEEVEFFDVKDITAGIPDFPADDTAATESYLAILENPWIRPVGEAALSTFSIDVDTAGYSIVRRCLVEQNRLPPPGALRVEELVNYFPYAYDGPVSADPFAVHVDAAACPWAPSHRLVRIALKGREFEEAQRPAANLVFLLDVSGSMAQPNKLPLVKKSIEMLTDRLTARDRVAMVVYAGNSGLVLPSTPAGDHAAILSALDHLEAGGSTNGGAGIELAYKVAAENFVSGGINRVVLATDGDFNVGVSDPSSLVKMVEEKAKSGVFLTALGYGMDNLKDSTLEQLADKGNGNYGYVDNLGEARKVLVEQGMSTLHCIAKDVKIQVEFNPAKVAGYRLLGYENRMLAAQDFADDQKDAGEIGAGHTVTALYEVVPAGVEVPGAPVDELRYQRPGAFSGNAETLVVKLRWKEPEGAVSTPREFPFVDAGLSFESASADFRFAAGVAAFGMVLRDSKQAGSANLDLVREIAASSLGPDAGGYRAEFVTLVEKARALKK